MFLNSFAKIVLLFQTAKFFLTFFTINITTYCLKVQYLQIYLHGTPTKKHRFRAFEAPKRRFFEYLNTKSSKKKRKQYNKKNFITLPRFNTLYPFKRINILRELLFLFSLFLRAFFITCKAIFRSCLQLFSSQKHNCSIFLMRLIIHIRIHNHKYVNTHLHHLSIICSIP